MSDDPRFLKRKVKTGSIDVHPTEKALVVNYELEATILGELGDPMLGERKECQKIIRLKSLTTKTDINALAKEVVDKCKLIHVSKISEVQQLLYYLQHRKEVGSSKELYTDADVGDVELDGNDSGGTASFNNLEEYVDLFYEDMPDKIRSSALILQLARNPDNLEELAQNETLTGGLSRVLREDWKKSMELSTNIFYVFFCFSTFSQFHPIIARHKIGSLCMEIIEYELNRHELWKEDVQKRQKASEIGMEFERERNFQEYETSVKKYNNLVRKQEQLLRVAFYLLLNVAEDIKVEQKMVNKNIVGLLIRTLDRENHQLVVLVITFLKKLSLFRENKLVMTDSPLFDKLSCMLPATNLDLVNAIARLLFNLSFDGEARNRIVKAGLLPKIVELIDEPSLETVVIRLLYHLSIDDKCKSMFTYTDCIPKLMKRVLESKEERVPVELMSLCINLAANKRNAQLICEGGGLKLLFKRAFKNEDPFLMKMLRNIAQQEGQTKGMMADFADDLAATIVRATDEDYVLECVGVLGNIMLREVDFLRLFSDHGLLDWCRSHITPGAYDDDMVLEVIILLGTAALDEACAELICRSDTINTVIELLNAKQEDDETVLQILYLFHQLVRQLALRDQVIMNTQIAAYLIDLMHDKNCEIRQICDKTLDLVASYDPNWAVKIQAEKFRWHNHQWLDMMENQETLSSEEHWGSDIFNEGFFPCTQLMDREQLYENESDVSDCDNLDILAGPMPKTVRSDSNCDTALA